MRVSDLRQLLKYDPTKQVLTERGTTQIVEVLDGMRFLTEDVQRALNMRHTTLTNCLKTDLALCSEPTGKGRARQYCLIDVYQIELFRRLMRRSKDTISCTSDANITLLHDKAADLSEPDISKLERLRKLRFSMCHNIMNAPKHYWHRDINEPYYFVHEDGHGGPFFPKGSLDTQSLLDCRIINLTLAFDELDRALVVALMQRAEA